MLLRISRIVSVVWSAFVLVGMVQGLVQRVTSRWGGDRLVRGFGVLGVGELFIRVSRVVTTIVVARQLGAAELGIAATALACFEIVRVLANNGIGQMVVRAPEERLAAICNTAWKLAWLACLLMASVQIAAGIAIAHYAGRPDLLWMIVCLAGVYALMPWGMVHAWLLQRDYRMGTLSVINVAQVGTDNALTAALAFAGFGAWAVVLPKLLTAPIWLAGVRRAIVWRRNPAQGSVPLKEIVSYSAPILASEILGALRFNADKMIVGALLGLEALGIYYFAFSAGYGLTMVLTGALAAASFPHLAEHRIGADELLARFDRALLTLALPICALIALQSIAVFYYVPIIFGEKWAPWTHVVAVLCVSAAGKPFSDLAVQLLRAAGLTVWELASAAVVAVLALAALAIGLTMGLLAGVTALTAATVSSQLALTLWARRLVARRLTPESDVPAVAAASIVPRGA